MKETKIFYIYVKNHKKENCKRFLNTKKSFGLKTQLTTSNCKCFNRHRGAELLKRIFSKESVNSNLVKKLTSRDYPFVAKCIWILIVLLCFTLTLAQIVNINNIYSSEPVSMNIKIIRNESLELPGVTICSKARFSYKKLRILAREMFERRNYTRGTKKPTFNDLVDEFGLQFVWDNTSYNIPQMLSQCSIFHSAPCEKFGRWIPVYTAFGSCYTYLLDTKITSAGPYQALYITLNGDDEVVESLQGWKILVHHRDEKPDLLIKTEGISMSPNSKADMVLEYRNFQSINTRKNPCNSSTSYSLSICETTCIYEILEEHFSCRLPYMDFANVSMCNASIYSAMTRLQDSILDDGTLSVPQICSCPRPCTETMYTLKLDVRSWISNNQTNMRIYYNDLNYQRVEEYLAYGMVSLLSDIGGNLGLFLGLCVVSIFELGEAILCSIVRLVKLVLCEKRSSSF